uniref:Uncharacterized protein n=1 Tax=Romanomermis culicivorax TaxID=13658 RepID=A0A915L4A8_ROMCU
MLINPTKYAINEMQEKLKTFRLDEYKKDMGVVSLRWRLRRLGCMWRLWRMWRSWCLWRLWRMRRLRMRRLHRTWHLWCMEHLWRMCNILAYVAFVVHVQRFDTKQ